MPASMSAHSKKHRVSTTDETWRQISKTEQPNGTPDVALQHCIVSSRRTHSRHSKTLKHAARLETCLMLQAAHTHLYNLLRNGYFSVCLLYGADTWTLLADDARRLQSFHMSCQRQIPGVKWQDHIKNIDIADRTGLPNIADMISKRRQALFGHVVRLDATTPAH